MIKEYVIKKRSKNNDVFVVQKKLNKNWRWLRCIFSQFELKEWEILFLMRLGRSFYTYNSDNDSYTPVVRVLDHIQSEANNTKVDNISKLPLI